MTDNEARAALAARCEGIGVLGPVAFVPLVRVKWSVIDRMTQALADLEKRWSGRRLPKAFYLLADDWAAFTATDPPTGRFPRGNNPTVWGTEPTFKGLPVRLSTSKLQSRLYDQTSTGRAI